MSMNNFSILWSVLLVLCGNGVTNAADQPATEVVIYRDQYKGQPEESLSESQRRFAPYGFMPETRTNQIAVNPALPLIEDSPEKGTCIEYSFQFKNGSDWMGAYHLVNGDSWGTKPGIDVRKLLDLRADDKVVLKFRAWGQKGGEAVTFQCGGVNTGPHKSSLPFPKTPKNDPTTLAKEPREYEIELKASQLSNVVDPFCVVARASDGDNLKRESITIFVDDIRFEAPSKNKKRVELPNGWRERLASTLWFDYTPSGGYDPTQTPPKRPTISDMRQDLEAIRRMSLGAGVSKDRIGVVLYGCRDGLEAVPALCRDLGLAVVVGVWDVKDASEVETAGKLLRDDSLAMTIAAVCVGNEAMTFGRANLDDILTVATRLREIRAVPTTSSEIIQKYGNEALWKEFDFAFPNVHALFNTGGDFDPKAAAKWTADRIRDLRAEAPKGFLIVVKEVGWVAGPSPEFDEAQQVLFWETLLADPVTREVNVCVFEAGFGQTHWKQEPITVRGKSVNVGPHWSVFLPSRQPNRAGEIILKSWSPSNRK